MKIWISGSQGQLGTVFGQLQANANVVATDLEQLDITNQQSLVQFLERERFDVLVNCAAYTQVDLAEKNEEIAYKVNAEAVGIMGETCARIGGKVIHISTDYVFDGTHHRPYREEDECNPQSVYGASKLAGEQALRESGVDYYILRTSWLYSNIGQNFLKTILRLAQERDSIGIVADQISTPTSAYDLAKAIDYIIQNDAIVKGIYHFANEGVASWYDFAKAIVRHAKLDCDVRPINTEEYPLLAKRPSYSVLSKDKFKAATGMRIPHWEDSLIEILKKPLI